MKVEFIRRARTNPPASSRRSFSEFATSINNSATRGNEALEVIDNNRRQFSVHIPRYLRSNRMPALDEQRLVRSIAPGVMSVDTGGEFTKTLISSTVRQAGGTWNQRFMVAHRNSPPVSVLG